MKYTESNELTIQDLLRIKDLLEDSIRTDQSRLDYLLEEKKTVLTIYIENNKRVLIKINQLIFNKSKGI